MSCFSSNKTDPEVDREHQNHLMLMQKYNKLQKQDPNHTKRPSEWLEFERMAKEHFQDKSHTIQRKISQSSIVLPAHLASGIKMPIDSPTAGTQVTDITDVDSKQPDEAAHSAMVEDCLCVPHEHEEGAVEQNAHFQAIVLSQANNFISNKKPAQTSFEKAAQDAEKSFQRVLESLRIKQPIVPWVPFSEADPCWMKAALVGLDTLFTDRAKYYIKPDLSNPNNYVYPLPNKLPDGANPSTPLRIAVVGDLGTNDKIHRNTLRAIKRLNPDLIIHLGDIYICGTSKECKAFWKLFESVFGTNPQKRPPFWSIPGNHEYISAGEGYFQRLVQPGVLGSFETPQRTSFFSLESDAYKLQIIGLDTGYNSKNFTLPLGGEHMDYSTSLHPDEATWAQRRLVHAKEQGWNTILLTHHQLYSAFWKLKSSNVTLADQLLNVGQPILTWMWGHEHKIGIYKNDATARPALDEREKLVKFGMCLGHGAVPEMGAEAYAISGNEPHVFDSTFTPDAVKVYANQEAIYNAGFGILEVTDSTKINMTYYQVDRASGITSPKGSMDLL